MDQKVHGTVLLVGLTARDTEEACKGCEWWWEQGLAHFQCDSQAPARGSHTQRFCYLSHLESPPPCGKGYLRSMSQPSWSPWLTLKTQFWNLEIPFRNTWRFPGLCGYLPCIFPRADSVSGTQPWSLKVLKMQLLWAWSEPLEVLYNVDGTRHRRKEDRQ